MDQKALDEIRLAYGSHADMQIMIREYERVLSLLARTASYLDYMEDRGYSSVRSIRSDVMVALRDAGIEPISYWDRAGR